MKTIQLLIASILVVISISVSAQITVKINSGTLNLRSEPNKESRVVAQMKNGTLLSFAGLTQAGWIKVNYNPWYNNDENDGPTLEGWVSIDFIESDMFHSTTFQALPDTLLPDGCGTYYNHPTGTIASNFFSDTLYTRIDNKIVIFSYDEKQQVYIHENQRIEFITWPTDYGYEYL
ncbi:MAG: SH3 domain-containing protein, partial [Flavobacteriales bacterium]